VGAPTERTDEDPAADDGGVAPDFGERLARRPAGQPLQFVQQHPRQHRGDRRAGAEVSATGPL
jgi:hypothetical protein